MTKDEMQKFAVQVVKNGLPKTFTAREFETILENVAGEDLEYYDRDLGYMVGFARALQERL